MDLALYWCSWCSPTCDICMQSTHTVRKELLTDSKEIAGSGLRHGTQPPPCVCSEGHPLDRSQTISLHFAEAPGISFQRTIVPTTVASTIWLRDILQAWQGDAASWYLSRAYSEDYERSATESEVECIHATHFLPVPDHQLKELQRETACDPTLQFSKKAILDGFPGTKEKQPAAIHQYFEIRDELSVHGGVIFKGQRCIIMQTLRQKIKQKLHDSHIGSQGCLCRALETVYWPGMNAKITDYIQKCDVCMSLQKNQTKVPLICHEPTSRSWEKVATDIIHTWWQELSVHSNYYSGYFEVDQLHGKTGTVITKNLKKQPTFKELSPLVKGKTVRIMPLPHDKGQRWFKAE